MTRLVWIVAGGLIAVGLVTGLIIVASGLVWLGERHNWLLPTVMIMLIFGVGGAVADVLRSQ